MMLFSHCSLRKKCHESIVNNSHEGTEGSLPSEPPPKRDSINDALDNDSGSDEEDYFDPQTILNLCKEYITDNSHKPDFMEMDGTY